MGRGVVEGSTTKWLEKVSDAQCLAEFLSLRNKVLLEMSTPSRLVHYLFHFHDLQSKVPSEDLSSNANIQDF